MVSLRFLWVQVKTVRLDEFTKDLGIHEAMGHHGTMGSCGVCRIMISAIRMDLRVLETPCKKQIS